MAEKDCTEVGLAEKSKATTWKKVESDKWEFMEVFALIIKNKTIDGGKGFDWGKVSSEYAKYRDIYPQDFYQKNPWPEIV